MAMNPFTQVTGWRVSLIVMLAFFLSLGLFVSLRQHTTDILAFARPAPDCNLQNAPCNASFPGLGKVSLAFNPTPVTGGQSFRMQVAVDSMETGRLQVDFRGLGMDMGLNRPDLTAVGDGRYEGEARLSICVADVMHWEATVLIHTAQGVLAAVFPFSTHR